MVVFFLKLVSFSSKTQRPRWPNLIMRNTHMKPQSSESRIPQKTVALFWDLNNRPSDPVLPHKAALKLKSTALSFGFVRHLFAYADPECLTFVPRQIRDLRREREALSKLENEGFVKPVEPYHCGVCGKKFDNHDKLVGHFKRLHEKEHVKRLRKIGSVKGKKREKFVEKYSLKIEKYKVASRDVLRQKVGYDLAEELKLSGFEVVKVGDEPRTADEAMKNHIVVLMEKCRVECVVIVSDDSGFVGVVEEARRRRVRTVVVGNSKAGELKRVADVGFSWREVLSGKAKEETDLALLNSRDRSSVLESSMWRYDPSVKQFRRVVNDNDDDDDDDGYGGLMGKDESRAWWEIESDNDDRKSSPRW